MNWIQSGNQIVKQEPPHPGDRAAKPHQTLRQNPSLSLARAEAACMAKGANPHTPPPPRKEGEQHSPLAKASWTQLPGAFGPWFMEGWATRLQRRDGSTTHPASLCQVHTSCRNFLPGSALLCQQTGRCYFEAEGREGPALLCCPSNHIHSAELVPGQSRGHHRPARSTAASSYQQGTRFLALP